MGNKEDFELFLLIMPINVFVPVSLTSHFIDHRSSLNEKMELDGIVLSTEKNFSESALFNQVLRFRMNNGMVMSPYEFSESFYFVYQLS